jgi:S1-C subfamily serine protease
MKRTAISLAAVCLIGLGAAGDHILSSGLGGPAAAAATDIPATQSTIPSTTGNTVTDSSPSTSTSQFDAATEHAYSVASHSVVYVVSKGVGSGSGVIYDSKGDIVTNDHVIDGATNLSVTLNDGRTFKAAVVGTDKVDDLAVIHINASNLTPASFASDGGYSIAQNVLAIGSPLGLKQSVTQGLISGLNRVEQEPSGAYLPNAIQTSAPINPGNSGGALVTLDGTVVGIPTLVQTSSGDGTAAQDVGFAIPAQRVTLVATQIIATGKVTHTDRAYLGIDPQDASSAQSSPFGSFFGSGGQSQSPVTSGAVIAQLSQDGPAAKAGLQQGDVIVQAGGQPITDAQDLLTVLASKKPGDSLSLKVDRSGQTMTVHVHLGELPA